MRKVIFVISILFFLLCLFGVYMGIGMRGDHAAIEVLMNSLPVMLLAVLFFIAALKFMRPPKDIVSTKKWPRIVLIIFLLFLFTFFSLINLCNTLPAKFYLFGMVIELILSIIFLPPLIYLIKPLKKRA